MTQTQSTFAAQAPSGEGEMSSLSIKRLGLSLSTFFAISYVICILGYLLMPDFPVRHEALSIYLPGPWAHRKLCLGLVHCRSVCSPLQFLRPPCRALSQNHESRTA